MHKLDQYALMSGAFLALGTGLEAQVVYTDLDPDLYTDGAMQTLDVDADGIDDFGFYMYFYTSWFDVQYSMVYMQALHSTAAIANTAYAWWIPPTGAVALDAGDEIGPLTNFNMPPGEDLALLAALQSYNPGFSCYSTSFTPHDNLHFGFPGTSYKYVGIRTGTVGDLHYGWIRLSVPYHVVCTVPMGQSFELIVHDLALNLTPNTSIVAGEGAPGACEPPTPLPPLVGPTAAKISWEPVVDAVGYVVQYRQAGALEWNEKTIPGLKTAKLIKSLLCNTSYEWQVSALCDDGAVQSAPCEVQEFTTSVCRLNDNADSVNDLLVFPNPANDKLKIDIDGNLLNISVYDLTGREFTIEFDQMDDQLVLKLDKLPDGIYLLTVVTNQGIESTTFIKTGN